MTVGSDYYVIPRVIYKSANPKVSDDVTKGCEIGQFWKNTSTGDIFCCVDNTTNNAVWYTSIFQIDPAESASPNIPSDYLMPDYQTQIDGFSSRRTFLVTPELMYTPLTTTIEYDLTIPAGSHALSFGGILTIGETTTVTIDGKLTIR